MVLYYDSKYAISCYTFCVHLKIMCILSFLGEMFYECKLGKITWWYCSNFLNAWKVEVLVTQSCPTLCDPMVYSLPSSSVHLLLQARVLDSVAIFFLGSTQPRNWTHVSCIAGKFFTIWVTREAIDSKEFLLLNSLGET